MVVIDGIKLVVFDLDDTLYPEWDFVEGGFRNVAACLAGDSAELADRLVGKMKELIRSEGRGAIFQAILTDLGLEATSERVSELVGVYRTSERPLAFFPDSARAIERFREAGFLLAVLTDGAISSQATKVRLLDLERKVDRVIYTDSYGPGFGKPCPYCFEVLMKEFSVEPEGCVYIADNEMKDFLAPNTLGWQTVKVVRPNGVYRERRSEDLGYQARCTVETLDELELEGRYE